MRPASSYLQVAKELALQAGARILKLRESPLLRERKADRSIVTNADREADRIIKQGLRKAFPDHTILTEESGWDGKSDAEYIWVVDPLDGTKAYAGGVTGYSVMVGLLQSGKPCAGVVFDPLEGHFYEAVTGEGTFHTFQNVRRQVHVSRRENFEQMPVITSTGFPKAAAELLYPKFPGPWIPAVNSVGVKIGYVAQGLVDIYVNHHSVHYWDTCAPQVILEEAGGRITFLDGRDLNYSFASGVYQHRGPTLATNGPRHQDILGLLQSVL